MRPSQAMVVLAAITLPLAIIPPSVADARPQLAVVTSDAALGSGIDAIPVGVSGEEALDALGADVPQAAAANEMTIAEFTEVLSTDDTAHLDGDANLYFVEPEHTAPAGAEPQPELQVEPLTAQSATEDGEPATAQAGLAIPALHSRPTSTHAIYLDFDGINLTAASKWTPPANTIPVGTYGGFTLDSSPDFNAAEIAFITKVHQIVSEKYAAFDVDVTTVDPGAGGVSRTTASDTSYGVHAVITNDPAPGQAICGGNCAGIAFTDVFDRLNNAAYDPAWIFANKTYGSAQITALDVAHEVGHTFGLNHDGGPGTGYYAGHANWVPIMGITNQKAVSQFSKGEYAGATNSPEQIYDPETGAVGQDDLAVIGANGDSGLDGSLLLADDHPSAGEQPEVLTPSIAWTVDGIIGSAADEDDFTLLWPCGNTMTVSATGAGAGQSVDLKVEVLDANNNLVATSDPASGQAWYAADFAYLPTGMDAAVSITPPAAEMVYQIRVSGVGTGDATTGYSDYGSIGRYTLEASGCPIPGRPSAPASVSATPNPRTNTGTVSWTAPTDPGIGPVTGYTITGLPGGTVTVGDQLSYPATNLNPGTTYTVGVKASNVNGAGPTATTTLRVATWAPLTAPGASASVSGTSAVLYWSAPANPGGATLTGWRIQGSGPGNATNLQYGPNIASVTITGLAAGAHTFTVSGQYAANDVAGITPATLAVTVVVPPSAPRIGLAAPGARGRPVTATVRWAAPASTGGATITSYRLYAYKLNSAGRVVQTLTKVVPASARAHPWRLVAARYKFRVVANNAVGASPYSAYSRVVAAR